MHSQCRGRRGTWRSFNATVGGFDLTRPESEDAAHTSTGKRHAKPPRAHATTEAPMQNTVVREHISFSFELKRFASLA